MTATDHTIAAARTEAARMRASVAASPESGTVTMTVPQFRRLAAFIDVLATQTGECGGECFNAPVDGVRLWVPLAQLEAERAAHAVLRDGWSPLRS